MHNIYPCGTRKHFFYFVSILLWSHKWKIIIGNSFSSAHILGEAMERVYGGHLCYGPPIEQGFYYDMYSEDHNVSDNDFKVCQIGSIKTLGYDNEFNSHNSFFQCYF